MAKVLEDICWYYSEKKGWKRTPKSWNIMRASDKSQSDQKIIDQSIKGSHPLPNYSWTRFCCTLTDWVWICLTLSAVSVWLCLQCIHPMSYEHLNALSYNVLDWPRENAIVRWGVMWGLTCNLVGAISTNWEHQWEIREALRKKKWLLQNFSQHPTHPHIWDLVSQKFGFELSPQSQPYRWPLTDRRADCYCWKTLPDSNH